MITPESTLRLSPIGVVRSPFAEKASAPRQPRGAPEARGTIELFPGRHYEDAVTDLECWDYIWILSWFHLNEGWRPRVLPPRSDGKRGVFATRSPHRPNPLGLSVARLERVDGLELHIAEIDLLDGTPVLDLKPYVAWADAIPDAGQGWLADPEVAGGEADGASRPADPRGSFEVEWELSALEQLRWLRDEHGVELEAPITRALALGPTPHAYRRIRPDGDAMRLAIKAWRARFRVEDRRVRVLEIQSGYRPKQLHGDPDPALDVHRAFVERFGWP